MSDVQMNQQLRQAWWVTCRHTDCDYESKPTLDPDFAEEERKAHFASHEKEEEVAAAVLVLKANMHELDELVLRSMQRLKRAGRI